MVVIPKFVKIKTSQILLDLQYMYMCLTVRGQRYGFKPWFWRFKYDFKNVQVPVIHNDAELVEFCSRAAAGFKKEGGA